MRPIVPFRLFGHYFLFCQAFSTRPCSSFKDKLRPLKCYLPSAIQGFKFSPISRTVKEMQHVGECLEIVGLENGTGYSTAVPTVTTKMLSMVHPKINFAHTSDNGLRTRFPLKNTAHSLRRYMLRNHYSRKVELGDPRLAFCN